MTAPATVLFACVHNAGRSQMAAAWFERLADSAKAVGLSAGTEPGTAVHPEVVAVMREVGIDLAAVRPQRLTDDLAARATHLITMGCGEACPVVPGVKREDWPLPDPKGQPVDVVRGIRNQIYERVRGLVEREGWTGSGVRSSPLATTDQIFELITAFRNGLLVKEAFTHRAHLLTGLWFLERHSLEDARRLMPEAIRRFNERVGTVDRPRGGYHETITQFYLTVIDRFRLEVTTPDWAARAQILFERFDDRKLILQYYSEDHLWSAEARARWVKPDLKPIDTP